MEIFATLLMLSGIVLFPVSLIMLIVKAIKHKKKKASVICIILSVVLLFVGIMIMPEPSEAPTQGTGGETQNQVSADNGTALTQELENFVGEYCMAYMDSLKNSYSFTVKYAWAHAIESGANAGSYSVYVKFTAENSVGGTVTDVIAAEVISKDDLKNFMPEIHTWGSEPSYKTLGSGQDLDVTAIQNYINKNYK